MTLGFSIFIFICVLSLLVFFHELGHFLAAKSCGIYVDRFSIFMPPRLFGLRIGETDYCLGAFPIGGYVKMAGQEDTPLSEEERQQEYGHVPPERWFNNKPVWQRSFVLLAGPMMNLVLAVVLYGLMAAIGGEVPEWELTARAGQVEADYPAATAPLYRMEGETLPDLTRPPDALGWQTGDYILSFNGKPVDTIGDLAITSILEGAGTVHQIVIERPNPDGTRTRYLSPVAPQLQEGEDYPRFGVSPFETAKVAGVLDDMPGKAAGLQEGDIINRANGIPVDRGTFIKLVEELPSGETITLEVIRNEQRIEVALQPQTIGRLRGLVLEAASGPESPPSVAFLSSEFAEASGLKRKDILLEVNGQPATLESLQELEQSHPGETLKAKVLRPNILFGLIQKAEELDIELMIDPVRAIGVTLTPVYQFHRTPPAQVIPEAFRQSYIAVSRTLMTLKALFAGDVSPKDLGGPLMIGDITARAAEAGYLWFWKTTAFISINLFIVNLLPLPVLDGGHLVLNMIESIRRKPLSPRFQERLQAAGILLIIGLMLFVTWNDIGRFISNITP